MISNRDRRNGLILTNSSLNTKTVAYGKYNNKRKARYNLSDIVLDSNPLENFDISNDSFKLSDDEGDEDEEDEFNGNAESFQNSDANRDQYDQQHLLHKQKKLAGPFTLKYDEDEHQDSDSSDVPYGKSRIINISISDNEDSDILMESPDRSKYQSTPKHKKSKSNVLQDISPIVNKTIANELNDKRVPLPITTVTTPTFQRNNSAGLSHLRHRSSINSNNSKRWSLLSFNNDQDKENTNNSNKSKRFSMASTQSSSSKNTENNRSKRFSIASISSLTDKDRSKRFSISSQISSTSSNSSSFKNVISKVNNVLTSVSIPSADNSAESTPYKNLQPGVVGEKHNVTLSTLDPSINSSGISITTTAPSSTISPDMISNKRTNEAAAFTPLSQRKYSQSSIINPSLKKINTRDTRDQSDNISLSSQSSLRSSRSLFRLSSIFSSSSKKDSFGNDGESIRSLRGKNSLSDMRKSVFSNMSSNFRSLNKKDSHHDLKRKTSSLDKTMISLPKPDVDSRVKLQNRLRNSSSIISINSVVSRQQTINTTTTNPASKINSNTTNNTNNTTAILANEYEIIQLNKLVALTGYDSVLNFQEYINQLSSQLSDDEILIKFAEASYSEVFNVKDISKNVNKQILKIIPFGDATFEQPSVENIVQELQINLKLSGTDGFIKLNESCVVKGSYPKLLLKLWDDYNELKNSNNYRPEFDLDQKYLILNLEYGGIDLENFEIKSYKESCQIFWSIVKILSRVEKTLQFEHRDLHWGNIVIDCISTKEEEVDIEDKLRDLSIIEEGEEEIAEEKPNGGDTKLVVKLIDYTLSRLYDEDNDKVIFTRLDHQDFFKGRGDYQFDIYRFMRNEIKSIQIKEHLNKDAEIDWSISSLKNNLYWLHYILDRLINAKKVTTKSQESDEFLKNLNHLYKSLDPRRKKLNDSKPTFKNNQSNKTNKKRPQVVYFQDFENCQDVLKFGQFYNMI